MGCRQYGQYPGTAEATRFPIQPDLRRIAAPGVGSSPREAWLKLAGSPGFNSLSRLHFKRIAARAMRQLLIESARRRSAEKRGAGTVMVPLDDVAAGIVTDAEELLALDAALEELARLNPRQALMVEARFFGGFDAAETAALLEISETTLVRDWRAARAWLSRELRSGR
jgi:RNA polymerase sigma factor (TIGR02999 family)